MKTLDLADVSRLPEELKDGETIELVDGGRRVATVLPETAMTVEDHIDQLIAEGKAHRGTGRLPDDFFTRPLPKFEGSVVEQLLKDRRSKDY